MGTQERRVTFLGAKGSEIVATWREPDVQVQPSTPLHVCLDMHVFWQSLCCLAFRSLGAIRGGP